MRGLWFVRTIELDECERKGLRDAIAIYVVSVVVLTLLLCPLLCPDATLAVPVVASFYPAKLMYDFRMWECKHI